MTPNPDPTAELRRAGYAILITLAVAVAVAKVVGAENVVEPSRFLKPPGGVYGPPLEVAAQRNMKPWPAPRPEPTPMFGSNDRSRWATIKALVEEGTYSIGRRENSPDGSYSDSGIVFRNDYASIDRILVPETQRFYSSKPPLLPTLLAGEYWLLNRLFGLRLDEERWWVVGILLMTVNVVPFAFALRVVARIAEEYGATDFGRLFVVASACFGTLLLTFVHTLTNHVPAACCALFALAPLLRRDREPGAGAVLASGFFAALAAAFELPALMLLAALPLPLAVARPKLLVWYALGAAAPLLAHFACNYAAMGRLMPAYSEFGGPYYNYPGSHWAKLGTPGAVGLDFLAEPKPIYFFHLTLGHHGWFSLTPLWLLAGAGLAAWAAGAGSVLRRLFGPSPKPWPWGAPAVGVLGWGAFLVLLAFYTWRTNNYGGNSAGPRWLFWVVPIWTLGLIPAADRLATFPAGRRVALLCLGLSALSAFYPAWNPWRSPWLMHLFQSAGFIAY